MTQSLHSPRLILVLLLPVVLAVTGFYLAYQSGWRASEKPTTAREAAPDLEAALKELDRADPGWRFGDLIDHRADVSDDQNAAAHVLAASAALPRDWPRQSLVDELNRIPMPMALTKQQSAELAEELKKAAPALAEARKLTDNATGRYEVAWRKVYVSTEMSHLKQVEAVEQLIRLEALRAAQEGEIDAALAAARRILNAGRSLGDEPRLDSCLVRMGAHLQATAMMERILANGEAGDAALADAQHLLANEADQNLLLIAARGERANLHGLLLALEANEVKRDDLNLAENELHKNLKRVLDDRSMSIRETFEESHAWVLLYLTEFVDIAKLPVEQQKPRLEKLLAGHAKASPAARLMAPPVDAVARTAQNSQAVLRSAYAALAVERYRRANGQWPETLNDLGSTYLAAIPVDPYDGKPVRFKRQKEGVVIYSLGPDGRDDGGAFETLNAFRPGTDVGFRLWDVDKRRQMAH